MVEDSFKEGKLLIVLKKSTKKAQAFRRMANQFESGKEYTEEEASQRLKEIYKDCALLRRYLVDYQYLERDKFGRIYRRCEQHTKII